MWRHTWSHHLITYSESIRYCGLRVGTFNIASSLRLPLQCWIMITARNLVSRPFIYERLNSRSSATFADVLLLTDCRITGPLGSRSSTIPRSNWAGTHAGHANFRGMWYIQVVTHNKTSLSVGGNRRAWQIGGYYPVNDNRSCVCRKAFSPLHSFSFTEATILIFAELV